MITIDGEEFAEADYGLVVDNSDGMQKLQSQLETLAQAALQNQTLSFSTIMKIYSSSSLSEKQRIIENDERRIREQAQQAQQQELQAQQQQAQMQQQTEMQKIQQEDLLNQRDNETKILVAQINAQAKQEPADGINDGIEEPMSEADREKLKQQIHEFNVKMQLEREKLDFQREKQKEDASIKRMQANRRQTNSTSK